MAGVPAALIARSMLVGDVLRGVCRAIRNVLGDRAVRVPDDMVDLVPSSDRGSFRHLDYLLATVIRLQLQGVRYRTACQRSASATGVGR
jgi:hypothetical protein